MKFQLAEVEHSENQHEMEPERWASARSCRVLKIMVKELEFYIREMGGG